MNKTAYVAYGSESGNAKNLAESLFKKLIELEQSSPFYIFNKTKLCTLNDLPLTDLTEKDTVWILTSSFGDGEPPSNANIFEETIRNIRIDDKKLTFNFAVFGLGDVSYEKFCGFSKQTDALLANLGACQIATRVDADINYQDFFELWRNAVTDYAINQANKLTNLKLQVVAYGENQYFCAKASQVKRLDSGAFPVYDIQIDITKSGMHYVAGDLLYVQPPVNHMTIKRIIDFYGCLSETDIQKLSKKELRNISKPFIRNLAKKTKNNDLKKLTKISASKTLAQYSYGRDIADVLLDYCQADQLSIAELIELLPKQMPRAYSIASCGSNSPNTVRLCVREVNYELNNIAYVGSASHYLCHLKKDDCVNVFMRANAHFHLPDDNTVPVIMIGAGTGIAPYIGFLSSKKAELRTKDMYLYFGERSSQHDFLYKEQLQNWLNSGRLKELHTAFSRDQFEKIYVQDLLKQNSQNIWQLIKNKAHIYVCGNKENLGKSIENIFIDMAKTHGKLNEEEAKNWLFELISKGRFHQDLY